MRVLIATGGSAHSQIAVQYCRQISQILDIEATILTIVKHEAERDAAEAILSDAQSQLEKSVKSLEGKFRIGQAAEEIAAEANKGQYDLLLLGERSSHKLITRLLGPTAQRVLFLTNCPVLIAKAAARLPDHLLICDSGYQMPNVLDRLTRYLPEFLTGVSEVTVLHVMSQISAGPGIPGQQLRASAEELIAAQTPEGEWLTQDLERLQQAKIEARPKIRHGLVVDEILAELEGGRYDLIVIGKHQSEGWQRFLLADVAREIVVKADRSVLLCP
ncbi:MAG: universal stress protein [Ardenticatenaceae bacterium]|nr:universal stress protein [Ardenticatenaceae bacterium]